MGMFSTMVLNSRAEMLRRQATDVADLFRERFGLTDGDMIEFQRSGKTYDYWTLGRIVSIDECYFNQHGGYTAIVVVLPLLQGGKVGNTRRVWMCMSPDGRTLSGPGGEHSLMCGHGVRRVVN